MKQRISKVIVVLSVCAPLLTNAYDLPVQWHITNGSNKTYEITFSDSQHKHNTHATILRNSAFEVTHLFMAPWGSFKSCLLYTSPSPRDS